MTRTSTNTGIHPDDTIMARATFRGRTVAQFASDGFGSLAEVIRAVRAAIGSLAGWIDLNLRNATRGWTTNRAIFIAPAAPGTQLSLF